MLGAAEKVKAAPVGKYLAQIAIVFAVQFVAGKIGGAFPIVNSGGIGPVWPASGTALAALLLCGYRVWPGVAAGAFLLMLLSPVPLLGAAVYGIGSALAALTGTFLLRRVVNFDTSLSRLRDGLGLIVFGAFGSSIVSASIGVSVLYAAHLRGWSGFGRAWLIYWLGDSMGVLLVTPLVLALFNLRRSHLRTRIPELIALLALLTMACLVIFGDPPLIPVRLHVLAFAVLPFVIWAAFRFGVSGAALTTLLVATIATAETAGGSGPFAQNTPFMNAVWLDVFFAVLSVSGLTLGLVIAEREQAEREREHLVREQATLEARLRLATIVESSDDAIVGKDINGVIKDWNKGAEQLYGYSASEVIGLPISFLMPPDHSVDFEEIMGKIRRGESVNHYETVRQRKDGTRVEVSLTMSPIRDTEGRILGASAIGRDISERKRQEAILRESEERLRIAAEVGRMYAWEWHPATDSVLRSAECAGILGLRYAAREDTGENYFSSIHPDDRAALWSLVDSLTPEEPVYRTQYRKFRPDGKLLWLEESGRAAFDGVGKMVRLVGMTADITERKLAEEKLREYEKAVEGSEEMIAVVDQEYRYLIANRKFLNLRKMTKEQVVGRLADEVLNKGVFEADVREKLDECFQGKVVRYEMKYTYPELGERDVFVSYFPIEGATGVDRVACILQDITDRKRTEEALRNSEERFRLAAQAGKMYAYEWDVATDKVTRSAEYVNVLGLSDPAKQLTREQLSTSIHPDDRAKFAASGERTPDHPTSQVSYRVLRQDGSVVWVEKNARAFFDEQGRLQRMVGMVVDITERKLAEEALRESEERLRLAAQLGKMYAFEWNAETHVTVRSGESKNILNWMNDPTNDVSEQFFARVHPDDQKAYSVTETGFTPENPTYHTSYRILRPDGSEIWLEEHGHAFFNPRGRLLRTIGIVADITARKLSEEALSSVGRRLIEAQEQERARIARELHDDFAQRLALLAVELEQLHQDPPDMPEVRRRVGELQKQTSEIATDIQTLSHGLHSAKLQYLGIAGAMRAFCREFGKQTKVKIDFKTHDLPAPLSPNISLCLFRVLQEALHNSAKHSGVMHVEVQLWGTSDEVHLTVSDSGAGFESEAAERNQGLGLISMEERLKLVKGTFSIESQPKRGTTIHARVPLSSEGDSMLAAG